MKRTAYYANIELFNSFPGSIEYWDQRYTLGGTSGVGSYGEFSEFKATTINGVIQEENITSVIEYGCGDGNQLTLLNCPAYIGFDVSEKAIAHCKQLFSDDETKTFKLMKNYDGESAELTLSLDVIYHIIEDDLFHDYMTRLFESALRFVIIYSSNTDKQKSFQMTHVKHRKFTDWIKKYQPDWIEKSYIPTKNKTFADFYVFQKI
ncbi:MAG: class I SAM-dependent methyltransferase [Balneolaceae bacterium]